MEFLILFTSGDISEDKQKETLNLGQAQILMDISQQDLMAIKVLLPTPLGEEAMNVVKKLAEKSELEITSDK
jgi:DNA-binding MarR family transcriptional regulator